MCSIFYFYKMSFKIILILDYTKLKLYMFLLSSLYMPLVLISQFFQKTPTIP